MRNIFLFVRRYFNIILFLLLQVFSVYLIIRYNKYHNAVASGYMNEVTGRVDKQYSEIEQYFHLKNENLKLAKENEKLLNELKQNFESPDTALKIVTDSIPYDTLGHHRKWLYKLAKVASNSVTLESNYIVLGRGSSQGLKKDMGVMDANNAVVGMVTEVSPNFTVVRSLLNKDTRINGKMKKGGEVGTVTWDGKEPNILSIIDIRQSAKVNKGDTVLSSGITTTFPYGLMIGTVLDIAPDKSSNNYIIRLKSAANFYNLQYVYAIENFQSEEINQLLEKAQKNK